MEVKLNELEEGMKKNMERYCFGFDTYIQITMPYNKVYSCKKLCSPSTDMNILVIVPVYLVRVPDC